MLIIERVYIHYVGPPGYISTNCFQIRPQLEFMSNYFNEAREFVQIEIFFGQLTEITGSVGVKS